MKEKGLSQRDAVDWIVQIVTLIQFHLGGGESVKIKQNDYRSNLSTANAKAL